MEYPVNELYATIQCEATHTGVPAVFVRIQGCNVGCGWCDQKKTWSLNKDNEVPATEVLADRAKPEQYALMSVGDILQKVALKAPIGHVVITGGEPAWFNLEPLTSALSEKGYFVQVETSGVYDIRVHPKTWVTLSPKQTPQGTTKLKAITRANEIKFIIKDEKDLARVKKLDEAFAIPSSLVWLQPLSQCEDATKLCINAAIRNGWRFSVQAQKYLDIR